MTTTLEHVIKDNSNAAFLARFALVIVGLHLVVGSFGLIAYRLGARHQHIDPAQEAALIQERIRPVARVATNSNPPGGGVADLRPEEAREAIALMRHR